jgi:hypothetical protein
VLFYTGAVLKKGTDALQPLSSPIAVLLMGLQPLRLENLVSDEKIEYLMIGAREFRQPRGFGPMISQRVDYLRFRRPVSLDLEYIAKSAEQLPSIDGIESWQWEVENREARDSVQFAIVQPSPTEVLVATNLRFLREIVADTRLGRGIAEYRQEWNEIDFASSFWAVRRYRHKASQDPVAAGLQLTRSERIGTNAIALTCYYDEHGFIVMRYITHSSGADILSVFWQNRLGVEARLTKAGVWQFRIPISDSPTNLEYTLAVLHLLGFGQFL